MAGVFILGRVLISLGYSIWFAVPLALIGGLPLGIPLGLLVVSPFAFAILGMASVFFPEPKTHPVSQSAATSPFEMEKKAEQALRDQKASGDATKTLVGLVGGIGLWFLGGYFLDHGHGLPNWYFLVLIAIPLIVFASAFADEAQEKGKFFSDIEVHEEGCLAAGFLWILVSLGLSDRLPMWAAALVGIPAALALCAVLIAGFKLLVFVFVRFRKP